MQRPNVAPTAEAIRSMAKQAREKAEALEGLAEKLEATGDLTLAANAANIAAAPLHHMDWLVMRPLEALDK